MSLLTNEYGDGFRARKPSFFDRIPKCQRISGKNVSKGRASLFGGRSENAERDVAAHWRGSRAAREFEGKQVSGLSRPWSLRAAVTGRTRQRT